MKTETARVFELPLNRHVVELAPEERAVGRIQPGRARKLVEPRRDEGAVELLGAVVQERAQVVDARAEERVLEVDQQIAPPGRTIRLRDW